MFSGKYGEIIKYTRFQDILRKFAAALMPKTLGNLFHYKILKEEASSSGVRRIKAVIEVHA